MKYTHQTAPTQFVEANGIRFAYRRFGKANGVPLVFNQHYLGTMDYWDPTVTDGLARDREVILFNNAGVSSTSGEVPTTFEQMGANAVAFTRALGLNKADVLGFSIGGMAATRGAVSRRSKKSSCRAVAPTSSPLTSPTPRALRVSPRKWATSTSWSTTPGSRCGDPRKPLRSRLSMRCSPPMSGHRSSSSPLLHQACAHDLPNGCSGGAAGYVQDTWA